MLIYYGRKQRKYNKSKISFFISYPFHSTWACYIAPIRNRTQTKPSDHGDEWDVGICKQILYIYIYINDNTNYLWYVHTPEIDITSENSPFWMKPMQKYGDLPTSYLSLPLVSLWEKNKETPCYSDVKSSISKFRNASRPKGFPKHFRRICS